MTIIILGTKLLLRKCTIIGEIPIDLGIPKTQRIDGIVLVAHDWHIIRHSHNRHIILVYKLQRAIRHFLHIGIAVEFYIDGFIRLAVFPDKAILQPVIRNLYLISLNDFLLEQPVLVTNAAAVPRQSQRCHRVDETGCEPSEAAIAKTCIRLFRKKLFHINTKFFERLLKDLPLTEIDEVRVQKTAKQELNREIINLFLLPLHIGFVRFYPVFCYILLQS